MGSAAVPGTAGGDVSAKERMHSVRDPLSRNFRRPSSVAARSAGVETLALLRTQDEEFERLRGEIATVLADWPEDEIRTLVDERVEAAWVAADSLP